MNESFQFDKTKEFEEEILPIVDQLHEACKKHNLPLTSSILVKLTDDEVIAHSDGYCNGPVPSSISLMMKINKGEIPEHTCQFLLEKILFISEIAGRNEVAGIQAVPPSDNGDGK